MPAAVRGESRVSAKPRAKTLASPTRRPVAKAEGARGGLTPQHILMIAGGVLTFALAVALLTGGRGQQLADAVGVGVDQKFGGAGFRLTAVQVTGASRLAKPDILAAADLPRHQPMLGLDLAAVKARVETVGWVQEARISRMLPDTLLISVKERRQLAVWQHQGRSVVIDDKGRTIPEADPALFSRLPLVVGAGGAEHAGEILPLLAQRPNLMSHLEALVRVDDRRWDLRLKDGSLIQLPSVDEEQALVRLEQLEKRSHLIALGFERIDLRNPDTVAFRPRAAQPPPPTTPLADGV